MARLFDGERGRKRIVGLVHLQPLPGTPFYEPGSFDAIADRAVSSALALRHGGADGCLIQTVDRVYPPDERVDPARLAALAVVVDGVVKAVAAEHFAVGVQIMRNAVIASIGVAHATGGSFVRATALVGATMSASGLVAGDPMRVAEYRQRVPDVDVVADIASMHFRWFGEARAAGRVARDARLAGADVVAVSHDDPAHALGLVDEVRAAAPHLPVLLAGGTDLQNVSRMLAKADGAFVGSCFERGGWGGPIDADLVGAYVDVVRGLDAEE